MTYTSKLKDVFYPSNDREARVAHFRIALIEALIERETVVTAIICLQRDARSGPYMLSKAEELDVVLNRIIERELRGVRVDRIRLLVDHAGAVTEYPLDFNAADLKPRWSQKKPWLNETDVRSRNITAGSGRALFVDMDCGKLAEQWLLDALASQGDQRQI